MEKIVTGILCILLCFIIGVSSVHAQKVVTIVHPVRSPHLWQHKDDLKDMKLMIEEKRLSSTWLVQYQALKDPSVIGVLREMNQDQEIGLFLEIDDTLATDAFAPYVYGDGDTFRADKILLSGYSPSERKRMIDRMMNRFFEKMGYFPRSVGAWYIDALSRAYLQTFYGITSLLDCSDQYVTDGYGLWGKPWGTPYLPTAYNPLIPMTDMSDAHAHVNIQWAPRDLVRGYGPGVSDSTYSVQANDYDRHGMDREYFSFLVDDYLSSPLPLNQMTVGIEVGQEGSGYEQQYRDQIDHISRLVEKKEAQTATMSTFSELYRNVYKGQHPSVFLYGDDYRDRNTIALWYSSPWYRVSFVKRGNTVTLRDLRWYDASLTFSDIWKADHRFPLLREIPAVYDDAVHTTSRILFTDIVDVAYHQEGENTVISLKGTDMVHTLIVSAQFFSIDGETSTRPFQTVSPSRFQKMLFWAQVYRDSSWIADVRFASLSDGRYVGVWVHPETLWGISDTWPYIGSFSFPYQTLTRFRTLPSIRVDDILYLFGTW